MENISFQYPSWFFGIALILSIGIALLLYYRTDKFTEKPKWLLYLLGILRAASIYIILFLLAGPFLSSYQSQTKAPHIALLLDQSQSVEYWLNNEDKLDAFTASWKSLINMLDEKYEVDYYNMNELVGTTTTSDSIVFNEKISDIEQGISFVNDIYEGENLGAVILATDGIYNKGKNPLYSRFNQLCPIYTIALGDTTPRRDLYIKNILYNEIAYLGDEMAIQVDIQTHAINNTSTTLILEKKTDKGFEVLEKKNIRITNAQLLTTELILDMNTIGINQYRIRVNPINGEQNTSNNSKRIYIEVLDTRQKLLLLANAPHPDIAALKSMIERKKNYTLDIRYENPNQQTLKEADFVIFHNLPSERWDIQEIKRTLDLSNTSRWFIAGTQTDIPKFNNIQDFYTITGSAGSTNESQGIINSNFLSFKVSDQLTNRLPQYPPLQAPFGEYKAQRPSALWLQQRIGDVETDIPLMSFGDKGGYKTVFLFGEGIWRWKMYDYIESSNFDAIEELIDQTLVFSTTQKDKRRFRVNTTQNVYSEREPVEFYAELYNASYQLINTEEVSLNIKDNQGNVFPYTMSPRTGGYTLNVGTLPPGDYTYTASTTYDGEKMSNNGRFSVKAIELELYNLQANHNLLYSISDQYRGAVFYPNQLEALAEKLNTNEDIKPLIYQDLKTELALNYKWLLALLALLLSAEWFLRRYNGSI